MYAERQARRRINQKKTREPAGVSARGLFCARIYAARRAQVAGCPPACARVHARAYLPGPCVGANPRRAGRTPALPPARDIYLIARILLRCPRVSRRQVPAQAARVYFTI